MLNVLNRVFAAKGNFTKVTLKGRYKIGNW